MIVEENFQAALVELNNALAIQKEILEAHDRRIAETHFHIARTHRNSEDFEKAAESFEQARNVMLKAIEFIEASQNKENAEKQSKDDVDEMKKVVEEIGQSILDARESAKFSKEQRAKIEGVIKQVFKQQPIDPSVPVNDLTSQLRKRPASQNPVATSSDDTLSAAPASADETSGAVVADSDQKMEEPADKKVKLSDDTSSNGI